MFYPSNYFLVNSSRCVLSCVSGPVANTISDFWRMVWEQNCTVIVMITKIIERGRVCCIHHFWNKKKNGKVNFRKNVLDCCKGQGKKLASRIDGNEIGYKAVGLDWQNNNFARASLFLYISLPSLHDYDVKMPNFTIWT